MPRRAADATPRWHAEVQRSRLPATRSCSAPSPPYLGRMILPSASGSTREACSSVFDEMLPSECRHHRPMTDMGPRVVLGTGIKRQISKLEWTARAAELEPTPGF